MKNRLEELRKARGIKQEELASALEVSRQTIGSLENGALQSVHPAGFPDRAVFWIDHRRYLHL